MSTPSSSLSAGVVEDGLRSARLISEIVERLLMNRPRRQRGQCHGGA
jgi:hypothetical protein